MSVTAFRVLEFMTNPTPSGSHTRVDFALGCGAGFGLALGFAFALAVVAFACAFALAFGVFCCSVLGCADELKKKESLKGP